MEQELAVRCVGWLQEMEQVFRREDWAEKARLVGIAC